MTDATLIAVVSYRDEQVAGRVIRRRCLSRASVGYALVTA
jgi:hypothetical protein